jgi:hypothetical protein
MARIARRPSRRRSMTRSLFKLFANPRRPQMTAREVSEGRQADSVLTTFSRMTTEPPLLARLGNPHSRRNSPPPGANGANRAGPDDPAAAGKPLFQDRQATRAWRMEA